MGQSQCDHHKVKMIGVFGPKLPFDLLPNIVLFPAFLSDPESRPLFAAFGAACRDRREGSQRSAATEDLEAGPGQCPGLRYM
jgi:hypothetical protein